MDNFYLIGLVLCSAASVALLFAQRYIKRDLLWTLRLSVGVGFLAFGILNAIHTHEREVRIAARQQQIVNIQNRLDEIKLRQANLKARSVALASEDAKAWLDPEAQKNLASRRVAVLHENEEIKAELYEIQKLLNSGGH